MGQRQHYVPKVYLKRFSYDNVGNFFSLRVDSNYQTEKVRKSHSSKECFEFDRFKFRNNLMRRDLEILDDNYIETKVFDYEKRELTELFDFLDYRKDITKSQAKRLLEILFSIKRRNPSFSKKFNSDSLEHYSNEVMEGIKKELEEHILNDEEREYMISKLLKLVERDSSMPNYNMDMYRKVIVDTSKKLYNDETKRIENLANSNFVVMQTDYDVPFITSDNPGFTLKNQVEVYNLELNFIDQFCFQISPRSLLIINLKKPEFDNLIVKRVEYKKASPEAVFQYNMATFHNANNKVFSNSNIYLNSLRHIIYDE